MEANKDPMRCFRCPENLWEETKISAKKLNMSHSAFLRLAISLLSEKVKNGTISDILIK